MREMRVSLTADDFKKLLGGDVVRKEGSSGTVAIGLQDIGYGSILNIVTDQYNRFLNRTPHDKEWSGKK